MARERRVGRVHGLASPGALAPVADLRLVPFGEEHLHDVRAMLEDPEILRFTRIPEPPPEDFPRRWLERYANGRRDGSCEGFAALDGDGRFVGLALVPTIDRDEGEVELGYIVVPEARGRGVATEMLRQLTQWAFDAAGAQRIVLIIDVDNPASERVAARCGYVREGVMRSVHLKHGIRIDAALWSRLPLDP
jgi:RimJ/RimL family protein N-acetyltransferase